MSALNLVGLIPCLAVPCLGVVLFVHVGLAIAAIMRLERIPPADQGLWVALSMVVPIVGPVACLIVGSRTTASTPGSGRLTETRE